MTQITNLKSFVLIFITMESKDELKEIDIKSCTCYYFDDILRLRNFGYNNIL